MRAGIGSLIVPANIYTALEELCITDPASVPHERLWRLCGGSVETELRSFLAQIPGVQLIESVAGFRLRSDGASQPRSTDVFVSYARPDAKRVQSLVRQLEASGLDVFLDQRLELGDVWLREIAERIRLSSCVLVCWTNASIQSHYVKEEALAGLSGRKLIPVLMEQVIPPFGFASVHAFSLLAQDEAAAAAEYEELIRALRAQIAQRP